MTDDRAATEESYLMGIKGYESPCDSYARRYPERLCYHCGFPKEAHKPDTDQQAAEVCWLCNGLGGIAIHNHWTTESGKVLWVAHIHPSDDDHPTYPCPACRLDAQQAEIEEWQTCRRQWKDSLDQARAALAAETRRRERVEQALLAETARGIDPSASAPSLEELLAGTEFADELAETPTGDNRTANDIDLLNTTDARIWAERFVQRVISNPHLATDEGAMISWFASAIETGRAAWNPVSATPTDPPSSPPPTPPTT